MNPSKKIKLGYKSAMPPKPHRNKREFKKEVSLEKFIRYYFNQDADQAMHIIKMYEMGNEEQQDRILTSLIVGRSVPQCIMKDIFKIGDYKYQRLKKLQAKRPSGGVKPNYVCEQISINRFILQFQLLSYTILYINIQL